MTIPRFEALTRGWERFPPVNLLVAAFTGYKAPPKKGSEKEESNGNLEDLVALFTQAGGKVQ